MCTFHVECQCPTYLSVWRLGGNIFWTASYCQCATSSVDTVNKTVRTALLAPEFVFLRFWAELFIFMFVYVFFYHGQLSHFPSCFGAGVTNLNEPPSSFLLPPHHCRLEAGSLPFAAIVIYCENCILCWMLTSCCKRQLNYISFELTLFSCIFITTANYHCRLVHCNLTWVFILTYLWLDIWCRCDTTYLCACEIRHLGMHMLLSCMYV